jgi:hypothetical protein
MCIIRSTNRQHQTEGAVKLSSFFSFSTSAFFQALLLAETTTVHLTNNPEVRESGIYTNTNLADPYTNYKFVYMAKR